MRVAMVVGVLLAVVAAPTAAAEFVPPALVTGADTGGGPHVRGWDARGGSLPVSLMAYSGIIGGVRVATADVDGDGRPEILAAPGEGGGSEVKIFHGSTFAQVDRFLPFGTWSTGVHVAGGDTDGDGKDEVVVGNGPACCTVARLFSVRPPRELDGFHLYGSSSEVGARVALGDFTGDGRAELATLPVRTNEGRVSLYVRGAAGVAFRSLPVFEGEWPTGLAAGDVHGDRRAEILVASAAEGGARVRALDATTGAVVLTLVPFIGVPTAHLAVAVGDVDGNGRTDVVTASSTADGVQVRAFDRGGAALATFYARDPALTTVSTVAAADLDGDGRAEIVLGIGPTSGEPRIAVFDGVGRQLAGFAYDEPFFYGGVRVAFGDVLGGARPEVVAAPGPGRPAEIRVFDPEYDYDRNLLRSFFPFGREFGGGLRVAAADTHGDRHAEIVVAPDAGTEPRVKVLDADGRELASFLAFEPEYRGGVRLAAGDLDADGRAEIAVLRASGAGEVRLFEATGEPLSPTATYPTGAEIGIADLRGDGRAEVLASEHYGGFEGIHVWDPWGDDDARLLLNGSGARLAAVDLDGDGRQEIAAAPLGPGDREVSVVGDGRLVLRLVPYPWAFVQVFVAGVVPPGPALAIDRRSFRGVVGTPSPADVAVFVDAARRTSPADFRATIDWADGSLPAPGRIVSRGGGRFAIVAARLHHTAGTFPVDVTVTDKRGRTVHAASTVTVAAAPLAAVPSAVRVRVGVRARLVLGRVRDLDVTALTSEFRVEIAWGDGTRSAGVLVDRGRFFDVAGVHRYRRGGSYRVTVRVSDRGGGRTVTFRSIVRAV